MYIYMYIYTVCQSLYIHTSYRHSAVQSHECEHILLLHTAHVHVLSAWSGGAVLQHETVLASRWQEASHTQYTPGHAAFPLCSSGRIENTHRTSTLHMYMYIGTMSFLQEWILRDLHFFAIYP